LQHQGHNDDHQSKWDAEKSRRNIKSRCIKNVATLKNNIRNIKKIASTTFENNIRNIEIYFCNIATSRSTFCNIDMKHLQHSLKLFETPKTHTLATNTEICCCSHPCPDTPFKVVPGSGDRLTRLLAS
jgi:hypothetical protein